MRHSLLPFVAVSMLALPVSARADDLGLIGVLPFAVSGPNDKQLQLDTLTEAIRTSTGDALSPLGYTVLTGDNTLRLLQDNGIDAAKACEGSCALDVARELKARLFISGTVSTAEGSLLAFVRIFDGLTGRQIGSMQIEGQTVRDLRLAFTAKANDFFQSAIAKLKQSGDVPTQPLAGKIPVVIETPTSGDSYKVELQTGEGVKPCPQQVTFVLPCKLQLLPGPVQFRATGSGNVSQAFQLAGPGERISLAHTDGSNGNAQRTAGIVIGAVGGLAALVGTVVGVSSISPSATCGTGCGGEPASASSVALGNAMLLYCALPGAVVGIVGLIVGLTPPAPLPAATLSSFNPGN